MGSQAQARARREQEFHDSRFAGGDGRRRSSAFYEVARPSQDRFAEWISEIPSGSRVLELGCGPDSVAWELWSRGVEVTGIDISRAAIDAARSRAAVRGIDPERFQVGNAERLDFDDGAFDAVIGSAILHHVELEPALAGIERVLTRGGTGLFHEPLGRNPAINLYRRLTPSERSVDEHPLTTEDLASIEDRFGSAEMEFFHLLSLGALPLLRTRAFAPVHDGLERIDRRLIDRLPRLATLAWIVLIRVQNLKQS